MRHGRGGFFFVGLIKKFLDAGEPDKKEKEYEIHHDNFWRALCIFLFLALLFVAILIHIYNDYEKDGVFGVLVGYALSFVALVFTVHICSFKVICYKETFVIRKFFRYRTYEYQNTTVKSGTVYTRIYCNNRYITKLNYLLYNSKHFEKMLINYQKKQKKKSKSFSGGAV